MSLMYRRSIQLLVAVCLLVLLSLVGQTAIAQSVTRATFKVIEEVQQLAEEERYDDAIAMLEQLVEDTKGKSYDHAIANQYLAHNSVMQDNIPRARSALEAALAIEGLPPEMVAELSLFYGSVLLGDEEFELATSMLENWITTAQEPTPRQIFTVAYSNYMNGNLPRAEELIARAIDDGGLTSPDSWYQVYYRILFDLKKYRQGEELLYELLDRDPSVALHWRFLASHYLQLEESSDALAAIMLSYMNNDIDDPQDLKQIVSLYGYIDVPEKAARLLETWMQEGKIETNADSRKQLGNLWLLAREREKAKVSLSLAASEAPDGKTFSMLGGIFFEDEDWEAAYDAYQQALELGGLDQPRRIALLSGISAYYAGMNDEAKAALEIAAESDEYRSQAEALLQEIDQA
jgi:tetratricopeptide (TPR) repeat protein